MKDYTKEIGFWKRLESFVSNVQTGCCAGEEEKEMIMHNCKLKLLNLHVVKPRFPKEQLHLKRGSRILNIRGRHIVNKPEILINCMEYWEPTDEDYGSAEENDATYFPTANEIDEIIKALTEAKAFLNGA